MEDVEPESLAEWTAALDAHLRLWVDHLNRTVVAETGDDLAEYAMWQPDGTAATLITLHVVPPLRRRGLGHRLLERFADDARAAGHTVLNLGVHERNPARFLYPATRYAQTGCCATALKTCWRQPATRAAVLQRAARRSRLRRRRAGQ
ncbi:GNAT family N-acetyltransferase [Lentzea sp. NPDC060358]|uniref:GNAT family N-acetyltransferase n=1 Tax=Lentzea sp. NPDC060358 TaxID=3347103 RepID=UPI00365575FE